MASYWNTRQAARMLGLHPAKLTRAIWSGGLEAPARSAAGHFLWTADDVRRASWALRHRDCDDVLAVQAGEEAE